MTYEGHRNGPGGLLHNRDCEQSPDRLRLGHCRSGSTSRNGRRFGADTGASTAVLDRAGAAPSVAWSCGRLESLRLAAIIWRRAASLFDHDIIRLQGERNVLGCNASCFDVRALQKRYSDCGASASACVGVGRSDLWMIRGCLERYSSRLEHTVDVIVVVVDSGSISVAVMVSVSVVEVL